VHYNKFSTCLRIEIISIDLEMAAKGKSLLDSCSAHDLKIDTIDEAKGALIRYELSARGSTMNFLGHPYDGRNRCDILLEDADGLHP
jgi:hypothetical protein